MSWLGGLAKTSGAIAFSKLIGFVRDLVIASYFGTSRLADAFNFASLLSGNFFILFGGLNGPFHSAALAGLSRFKGDEAGRCSSFLLMNMLLYGAIFGTLSFLIFWFAEDICKSWFRLGDAELLSLTAMQLRWMAPLLFLTPLIGISFGGGCARGAFTSSALSPIFSSLVTIFCILLVAPWMGDAVLAISASIGGCLQVLFQFAELARSGLLSAFSLAEAKTNLSNFSRILWPAMLSSTIGGLNVYIDGFFCAGLSEGSWTAILLANRLVQLPFGVLVGGALVRLLPRAVENRNQKVALSSILTAELVNLTALLLPVAIVMVTVGNVLVGLVFERGAFTVESTELVYVALVGLCGSLLTALPREVFTRGFYAIGDMRTPLVVAGVSVVWNALLDWFLGREYGLFGIALSTTLTAGLNSLGLWFFLRRNLGSSQLSTSFCRRILFMIFGGIVMYLTIKLLVPLLTDFTDLFKLVAWQTNALTACLASSGGALLYLAINFGGLSLDKVLSRRRS